MKRLTQITLAAAIVALAISPALTQQERQKQKGGGPRGGFGFGGGSLFLLGQEKVQKELKLSDEQIKKIKELSDKQREALQGVAREERMAKRQELTKANEKAIAKILDEKQQKRVKQISLQVQGTRALSNEEVAKELKLSDKQKDQLKEIQDKSREEMRGLFGGGGDREEAMKKMEKIRTETNEKSMGVLTADQKAKFKAMQGEPFKLDLPRPGGRGGRPGRPAADKKDK
jgi:Spy/CpxP family protein refolding chaperone